MVKQLKSPELVSWLAYLYAPILRYLKKIKIVRKGLRDHDPQDILVPEGYTVEVVATGFNTPVHCTFDDQGYCYVTEAGYKVEARPRILKVDPTTGEYQTFFELPDERWIITGALTGACWHDSYLYFTNTDSLSRLTPDGKIEDLVTGLPGQGDHQVNYPVAGPDGKIYFGVGTVTNTGVVGADNFANEWLSDYPDVHDVPARDVELTGCNYEFQNVLGNIMEKAHSGAFVPFGTETRPGQVIRGDIKCNGAILRCNPDGAGLEVVAWGLRNPYGIAFHPDGRLFTTEHGIDERGARYIVGDYDDFYEIKPGEWYGWPDFASGRRLDDPHWGSGGRGREPVMQSHPNPTPPRPFATFEPHSGSNGVAFCRDAAFGFQDDAFVALFGDFTPMTARLTTPAGFKVVRVDMRSGRVLNFAVNKITGPASKLPHAGFERPSHCQFGPDGALYVVDWGELEIAPERGGVRMQQGTGTLWRIRRTGPSRGEEPVEPVTLPYRGAQYVGTAVLAVALAGLLVWGLRRLIKRKA
jgi:glucose/arabinose dehydrogenase